MPSDSDDKHTPPVYTVVDSEDEEDEDIVEISQGEYTNSRIDAPKFKELAKFIINSDDVDRLIYEGSFIDAFQKAREQKKFLICFIYARDHNPSLNYCTEIFTNEIILTTIRENDHFILWVGDFLNESHMQSLHNMGQRNPSVNNVIPENKNALPYTATMCYSNQDITMLDVMKGYQDPNVIYLQLLTSIEMYSHLLHTHNPPPVQSIPMVDDEPSNHQIRQQQDVLFQESLLADQKQEEERKAAEEEQKRVEAEALRLQQQKANEAIEQEKVAEQIRQSYQPLVIPDNQKVHVRFRLLDGSRLEGTFSNQEKVLYLFEYLFAFAKLPMNSFVLVSNFPRKQLNMNEASQTIAQAFPNTRQLSLFVENE